MGIHRPLVVVAISITSLLFTAPAVEAHNVVCSNDAQQPFFNGSPDPGRAVIQGATIIDCTPSAPDAQRTEVQLQWTHPDGIWNDPGGPGNSFSNRQFHRVYGSTTCLVGRGNVWRTKAKHTGTHGNAMTTTNFSWDEGIYCSYNV